MNVLVVDDYEANRCLLRCLLEEQHHSVIEAENGEKAVNMVREFSPDLILMDVMMPVMDGYEATKIIKKESVGRHLPVIFLTAVTNEEALAEALAVGGDDFLTKPFNEDILNAKIKAHSRIKELNEEISKTNKELSNYKAIIDHERDIAEHVFNTALMENYLSSSNIQSYIAAATTFNGDLLLGSPGPSGNLYLLMADFTGHGLPAAIGAIPLSQEFFKLTRTGIAIGDLAKHLNSSLRKILPDNMFCAATIIEQNSVGTEFRIWAGGLPNGLILSKSGKIKEELPTLHMPLAVLEDDEFERDVHVIKLAEKESLFFFTDGLTEAENENQNMYGEERLYACLNSGNINHVEEIITEHDVFLNGQKPEDDITILRVFAQALDIKAEASLNSDIKPNFGWKLDVDLDADTLKQNHSIPEYLINMIGSQTNINTHKDYLHTIFAELYSNALEHGVLGLSSKLKDTENGYMEYYQQRSLRLNNLKDSDSVNISMSLEPGVSQKLKLTFKDTGKGFEFENRPKPNDNDSYGRGIELIRQLCESLKYSESGTRVDAIYLIGE